MTDSSNRLKKRRGAFKQAVLNNLEKLEKKVEQDAEAHEQRVDKAARDIIASGKQMSKNYDEEVSRKAKAVELEEQEMARRVLARRSLLAFIMRFEPNYKAGWVHKHICMKLEKFYQDVIDGKRPRLMLFMPPRAGKSLIASHYFPAWVMGHDPSIEIIATSYSSQLAESFSRKVRRMFTEESFKSVFKARLDPDSKAVSHWSTTNGGSYVAAGVGGGITGKGASIFIIDDPIRNQDDADSFLVRESQKGWYESTAYTRLSPVGGVLLIQTRWHMDDLSGWLEDRSNNGTGDKFDIVRFPAIAIEDETHRKIGDALHPERYPIEALEQIKQAVGPRTWAALYQQNPVPEDGAYFKKSMFHFYDKLPARENLRFYSCWDFAIGQKETNDYTVGVIWAVDPDEIIYISHFVRGHFGANEIIDNIITTAVDSGVEVVVAEKGQILMALGPALNKSIQERRAYSFAIEPISPGRKDKSARARSIQARMMQGRVLFPANFANSPEHTEMLQFPSGKHDDFVDAVAYIGLYLEQVAPGALTIKPHKKGWRDRLKSQLRSSGAGSISSMAS